MSRCLALTLGAVLALPVHALAAPPSDDAQTHFEAAAELYAKQDYKGAAREFAIAYALEPSVDTMFAWAQAERRAGDLDEAAKLYERLLGDELSAKQREAVEQLLAEVRAELGQQSVPPPPPPSGPGTSDGDPTDDSPSSPRGKPDPLGIALTAVGAGLVLAGGGLILGGALADNRVREARTYAEFESSFDPATGRGRGAVIFYASGGAALGVGLGTLIAGAVRLAKHRRKRSDVALTPWLGPETAGLTLTWPAR